MAVGSASTKNDDFWVPPQPGSSNAQIWVRNSQLAADHVTAGSFESAMLLLNQQAGIVNFDPLKPIFLSLYTGSNPQIHGFPSTPSLALSLQRNGLDIEPSSNGRQKGLPLLNTNLGVLTERLKLAYKSTTGGKFNDAFNHFVYIIHAIPLTVVDSKQEVNEVHQLLGLCREYITGLTLEMKRKELSAASGDAKRQLELAAYFTHCNLQVPHLILSLRSAMNFAYRSKNYNAAASFARRLLDLSPKADIAEQARKVVKFNETNPTDALELDYDERNPFVVCGGSFTPIYSGNPLIRCSYCGSSYKPEYSGTDRKSVV